MQNTKLLMDGLIKTLESQKQRALLTARKLLQDKAIVIENDIRGLLRNFGLKVGIVGLIKFEERIFELVEGMPLARQTASVVVALRCRTWPIAHPSIQEKIMHHQNTGSNT